jgi:hypothetical protein
MDKSSVNPIFFYYFIKTDKYVRAWQRKKNMFYRTPNFLFYFQTLTILSIQTSYRLRQDHTYQFHSADHPDLAFGMTCFSTGVFWRTIPDFP